MFFELLLISVVIVTGYLSLVTLRQTGPAQRVYRFMLLANCALAAVAWMAHQGPAQMELAQLLGVVAIGASIFLVMVPSALRDLAARAYRAERIPWALRLLSFRELLQPGMGAAEERELLASLWYVREGGLEDVVAELRTRRTEATEPLARRRIDERILMFYLYGRRWDDAVEHFERDLGRGPAPAPQTSAEMVRAYCEIGDLERAAELLEALEQSPMAREPLFSLLIHRARLVFLAFAGRIAAVDTLVAPTGPLGEVLPASARQYWSGVARLNAGDVPGARDALTVAGQLARRDVRVLQLVQDQLSAIDAPGVAGPRSYPGPVGEFADRLEQVTADAAAAPAPAQTRRTPRMSGVPLGDVPVTVGLVAANVIVALAALALYGAADSPQLFLRAGSLYSAVELGQWWRLPASMFVHGGWVHLAFNMYALWVLGKLLEQMLGARRFFAVYMLAGFGGALASHLVRSGGLSVGASGAVFGLMGAVVVELALHGSDFPSRWRRSLLSILTVFSLANIAIGLQYAALDQAAHVGGLLAGALVGLLLSPAGKLGRTRAASTLTVMLTVVAVAASGYAVVGAVTNDYGAALLRLPTAEQELIGVRMELPASWRREVRHQAGIVQSVWLVDDSELSEFSQIPASVSFDRLANDSPEKAIAASVAALSAKRDGGFYFARVQDASPPRFSVPAPWVVREVVAVYDGLSFRLLYIARWDGKWISIGEFLMPNELTELYAPIIERAIASIQ